MRRLLFLACAIVFVDTAFYAAITPLLPGFEDDYQLSKSAAGVLVAAYPAGTLVGAIPGGYLAAKAGVRATVLLGLGLMVVSSIAFAFADSIAMLDTARFVQGVGGAASWAGAMAWVASAAPRERRGEMIGTAMGAAVAGALAGPAIGTLADAVGISPTFAGIAVVGALLMLWALRTPPAPPEGTSSPRELLAALRDGRVAGGIWLIAVPGLLFGTIGVLAPLRLDELGAGAVAIAAAFLFAAALEAIAAPIVGRVSDRRGRLVPSIVGVAGGGLAMLLLPWPQSAWVLAGLVVLAGPAIGILYTPAMAMLSDGAEAFGVAHGFAFALVNLAWASGQTAGAAGSARLADLTGDRVPYLLLAGVCAVTLVVLVREYSRRPARAF